MTNNLHIQRIEKLLTNNPTVPEHCKCLAITKRYAPTIAGQVLRSLTRKPQTAAQLAEGQPYTAVQVRSRMRQLGIPRVGGGFAAVAS